MPASKSRQQAKKRPAQRAKKKYWSSDVTRNSDALDLEPDVFKKRSPADIASSLKQSAERSQRRKASPFRSAMSMLTFYINARERTFRRAVAERSTAPNKSCEKRSEKIDFAGRSVQSTEVPQIWRSSRVHITIENAVKAVEAAARRLLKPGSRCASQSSTAEPI